MKQETSTPLPSDYNSLLLAVKERVRSAQYAALKAVNSELVGLYWDIGRMIVERQADAKHGLAVAEHLAKDLRAEFPGIGGFSRRNVFYMREFFLIYRHDERVQPLVAQIGWSHNLIIFQKCKDPLQREFYLRMTALDHSVRQEDENPSIGIILCKEKKRTVVEYALYSASKPIGVATYQIHKSLPQDLAGQLPSPEKIAALLDGLDQDPI